MSCEFRVGERVQITLPVIGTVRYIGKTEFGSDDWVGVELDDPMGKHDGSVRNNRYFTCPPCHGLFVRPKSVITLQKRDSHTVPSGKAEEGQCTAEEGQSLPKRG
eukprot:CAMPEP_0172755284 /NCGR_PEP_ID=MMETSP1074-20121228/159570_1 /TAXON_ID=2916 /ORGANISM="Ceratium fusus, Strain PA161109" /LENGTH=104 /DNA_ID=CAMNT_0013588351 /DNA_START=51 /DNA_END=361 /DNA_ORIENTATION=-